MRAEIVRLTSGQDFDQRPITPQCFFSIHHWAFPPLGQGVEVAALTTFRYHRYTKGWRSIGYHVLVGWPDGDTAIVGDVFTARADIWGLQPLSLSICLEGDWSTEEPPVAMLEGARCAIGKLRAEVLRREPNASFIYGLSIFGHREKALPESPTACPGDGGMRLVEKLRS